MIISILTLFPRMFAGPLSESIVKRAIDRKLVTIEYIQIRDFATDTYKTVDDHPYGGGVGMVMRVDVVERAIQYAKSRLLQSVTPAKAGVQRKRKLDPRLRGDDIHTVLLDPRGKTYTQKKAVELSKLDHLILLCGHYEGVDERIRTLVNEEISIGDYILTGGEIPAMALVDSIVRLIPGVLKKSEATQAESFSPSENTTLNSGCSMLEYPQYTRPAVWNNLKVPSVLLSGNHKKIREWHNRMAKKITKTYRPDLMG